MAWATAGNVTVTNLDSALDSPAEARVEIYNALIELQNVINGRGAVDGVASLDSDTRVPSAQMPNEINSASGTDLTLDPATGVVTVEDIINARRLNFEPLNAGCCWRWCWCSSGSS